MISSSPYRSTAVILPRNCMIMCKCKFKCTVDTTSVRRRRRRRLYLDGLLVPNAKKKKKKKLQWWEEFFLEEDGDWFGWKKDHDELSHDLDDDDDDIESSSDSPSSSSSKFEAWKRRAEAITELREAQQDYANQESRQWQDWLLLDDSNGNGNGNGNGSDWEQRTPPPNTNAGESSSITNFDDDDLLYQDRVFRYASLNSAKFLAISILIPWASAFLIHDYALMPFLDRYVRKVPLAAQILDVRREQKLVIVQQLKLEQARLRLEVEIGKLPPLSDDQLWSDLRHKAIELRDARRLENRSAFANIWSDMVFGISLFLLLYCNQNQVALLKFTGYKIITNISDTGKAFLIILVTDIFLGYHSESGWQTLVEIFVEHYGLQVDQASITIFVCVVPVIIDACVKLWMFKFLPRLSPKVANIFREMKRH